MASFSLEEKGSLKGNVGLAVVAQAIALLSSVMMTIVVPKVLGIEEYAYWQLFTLYVGYVGLLLFGIHDGIFLRLGGISVDRIDWPRIKTQFALVAFFQIVSLATVGCVVAFSGGQAERVMVLLFVVANGLITNPASFLFYLLRAANLPNIYSKATMLSGAVWAVLLVMLTAIRPDGFELYALGYLFSQLLSTLYCYAHFCRVFKCGFGCLRTAWRDCRDDCISGLKVTLAYYAGTLVVGFCRMLVDFVWGVEAFGLFSLSVSLVNFLLTFMAQVSMVVFPVIRRMGDRSQSKAYLLMRDALVSVLPLVYVLYFPGCIALEWWLPQYGDSLRYLAIILPVCVFDCKMQLLVNTYLKSMRKESALMWINMGALVVAVVLMTLVAFATSSIVATVAAMVAAVAVRSIAAELYLGRFMRVGSARVLASEIILAVSFVVSAYLFSSPVLVGVCIAVYYCANRACVKELFLKTKLLVLGGRL